MRDSFNLVDILILLSLVPAVIGGLLSGFVRQAASLVALIVGVWGGWHFASLLASFIRSLFGIESGLLEIISFTIIFIAVVLAVVLLGKILSGLVKLVLMGWLDKLAGVLFSILKYLFILGVFVYLLESLDSIYPFMPRQIINCSKLYPLIKGIIPSVMPFIQKVNLL